MECKSDKRLKQQSDFPELIDTLWNVNTNKTQETKRESSVVQLPR